MGTTLARETVFGATRATRTIGILAALSLLIYLTQSRAVTIWLEEFEYLAFILGAFLSQPTVHGLPFDVPVSALARIASVLSAAACLAVGSIVARGLTGQRAAAPLAWVAGLAAAVLPALTIATLRWPDGGGSITPVTTAVGHLLFVLAAWWWTRSHGRGIRDVTASVTPPDGLAGSALPAATAPAGAAQSATAQLELPALSSTHGTAMRWWARGLLGVSALFAVVVLAAGLSGIQGHDSFSDHIARPARWLVTGRLEGGVPGEIVTFYPGNFELLVQWTLALGTDRLGFFPSYLSSVAATWVVYRLALEIGQSRSAATISAVAAASLQVLAYQSMVVYSDSYTALCLLLATWLLIIWKQDGTHDRRLTFGFGVALGLAMGAKYSAGPPAVVLGLFWAWHASHNVRREGYDQPLIDIRYLAPQLAWLVAGALPPMAFWYARNTVLHGNPLYPLSVAGLPGIPLGNLLAGGPSPQGLFDRFTYPWAEAEHVLGFETGLGAAVAAVVIFAVALAPTKSAPGSSRRLLWFVLLASMLAWINTGILVPRYGLFPLLLSFVFVGFLLEAFPSALLRLVTGTAVAGSMAAVGFQLAGGAAYNMVVHDPSPPVPTAINSLPPTQILNLAGQPFGYYAMGRDYRHRVLTPFGQFSPEEALASGKAYVLLPREREAEFLRALPLELVEQWERDNWPSTALWRLR